MVSRASLAEEAFVSPMDESSNDESLSKSSRIVRNSAKASFKDGCSGVRLDRFDIGNDLGPWESLQFFLYVQKEPLQQVGDGALGGGGEWQLGQPGR